MNKYALYSDSVNSLGLIDTIYRFCKSKNNYCDFNIFSNNEPIFYGTNIGTLPTFYMKFYNGSIIFCNIKDYIEYEKTLLHQAYLITSVEEMVSVGHTKSSLKNVVLLKVDGDTIHEI